MSNKYKFQVNGNLLDIVMIGLLVVPMIVSEATWLLNIFNIVKPFYIGINILVIFLMSIAILFSKHLEITDDVLTIQDNKMIHNKHGYWYVYQLLNLTTFIVYGYTLYNFLAALILLRFILVATVREILISKLKKVNNENNTSI